MWILKGVDECIVPLSWWKQKFEAITALLGWPNDLSSPIQ